MRSKLTLAAVTLVMLSPTLADSQFRPRRDPCVDLPELGSLLETQVVTRVEQAPGGMLRYTWRVTALPASSRTIVSASVEDVAGQFTGPAHWGVLTGGQPATDRPFAMFRSYALDSDAYDLKAPNSYEFGVISDRLPSPTLMIIYPRRETCVPNDEEWPALERKGWTHEKLGRLHRIEYFTNREIIVGPVIEASTSATPAELFARSMRRLSDLQEYVAFLPANREPGRHIPRPTEDAGAFTGLSMQAARVQAAARIGERRQDLAVIETLHQFYLSRQR